MATTNYLNISRKTYQKLSTKHPFLKQQIQTKLDKAKQTAQKAKENDSSSWPRSLQIAGYTAVVLAVPYSLGVIVSESPRVKDFLEEGNMGSLGQNAVNGVRWVWGEEEELPYSEVLNQTKRGDSSSSNGTNSKEEFKVPLSLKSEVPQIIRKQQETIQKSIEGNVRVSILQQDGVNIVQQYAGSTHCNDTSIVSGDKNHTGSSTSSQIPHQIVAFEDDVTNDNNGMTDDTMVFTSEEGNVQDGYDLKRLVTTWSAWNYFPPQNNDTTTNTSQTQTSSSSTSDQQILIQIEELTYNISELQKSLQDPNCTRDRDDMEKELRDLQGQLKSAKSERRWGKMRNLLGSRLVS